jgi:hypothetical protein
VTLERFIRLGLRTYRDVVAVKNGRIVQRIGRRAYGKATGRVARILFDPKAAERRT